MINPRALSQFLNQPRDDFAWVKNLSRKELVDSLESLHPRPNIDGLMVHQLASMLCGIAHPTFAFWLGPGAGKTLVAIRLAEYWRECGVLRKALVMVPSSEAVYSWSDEIRAWKSPLPVLELGEDSSAEKAEQYLEFEDGLILLPYPSLRHMVSVKGEHERTGKGQLKPRRGAIEAICRDLGMLVLDESTEAAHTDTLNYRVCRAISKRVPIRYALAGRPFGRDPFALWPQQYLVDHGVSLGPTQEIFRAAFYESKKNFWGGKHAKDYTFKKDLMPKLSKMSGHRSLQYTTEECVDLPPLNKVVVTTRFPPETLAYYEKVVTHLIAARGDRQVIHNDFIRMRQLASGFLGVENDEAGAKVQIEFSKNPKLDAVLEKVLQVPFGCKSVIFYEYTHTGRKLSERLKKHKIKHKWLWAGARDRRSILPQFRDDPDCEVLVLQHSLGSYVLNLQHANYFMYMESPVGCIDRDQSQRRGWRKGQTKRVTLYDFVMEGAVDERILQFHASGEDLFAAMLRNPKTLLFGKR